jgi:hypothetical protein
MKKREKEGERVCVRERVMGGMGGQRERKKEKKRKRGRGISREFTRAEPLKFFLELNFGPNSCTQIFHVFNCPKIK